MNSCCAIVMGLSLVVGQAPVNEHLRVLEPMIGEWEGDFPVPETPVGRSDSMGLEGRETVPAIVKYAWGDNGQSVILYVGFVIDGVEHPVTNGIMTWCPKSKAVVGFDTYASGTIVRYTIRRDGNRFHWDIEGTEADGDDMSYKINATISPTGEFVTQATERMSGGKRLPDNDRITLHRVDMQSTVAEFVEFCGVMAGRWVGEVTWVADWPGMGQKGEKVTCYSQNDMSLDGKALILRGFGGAGAAHGMIIYDAGAKRIRWISVSNGGTFWTSVVFKQDGQWVNKGGGSNPDGKRLNHKSVLTISADGKTNTWKGAGAVGDAPTAPQHDVYRRVGK